MVIDAMEILNKCKGINMGYDEVKVVNICEFSEIAFPDFFSNFKLCSEREKQITEAIIDGKEEFYYYGMPKEDFFIYKAIDEAKEKGLSIVIVENMS